MHSPRVSTLRVSMQFKGGLVDPLWIKAELYKMIEKKRKDCLAAKPLPTSIKDKETHLSEEPWASKFEKETSENVESGKPSSAPDQELDA